MTSLDRAVHIAIEYRDGLLDTADMMKEMRQALAALPGGWVDAQDAARYRLLREEGRDLSDLLQLVVGLKPGGHGTTITALRHTHYLDAAVDKAMPTVYKRHFVNTPTPNPHEADRNG